MDKFCVMITVMKTGAKRKLEIKTWEIRTDHLKKTDGPLRIVFLADLHDRLWGEGQEQLLEAIDSLNGDLILGAGDMLVAKEHAVKMEHALLLFEELAGKQIPIILSNGNHESRMRQQPEKYDRKYGAYADRLKSAGVHILSDEAYEYVHESSRVKIYGYEMPLEYYHKLSQPVYKGEDLEQKFGKPDEAHFHILMAHNPVYFDTYAAWGADLTLAGHLHGGIIRIPGIGGVITPQVKLFPKYDRGLFEKNGKYMVVSAGLGEHTVPIRIFNPPQLILIKIEGVA